LISEILATRDVEQIVSMKIAYERIFDTGLEDDIADKTSGHLERIYRSLLCVSGCEYILSFVACRRLAASPVGG
jgi:hypothetical protein